MQFNNVFATLLEEDPIEYIEMISGGETLFGIPLLDDMSNLIVYNIWFPEFKFVYREKTEEEYKSLEKQIKATAAFEAKNLFFVRESVTAPFATKKEANTYNLLELDFYRTQRKLVDFIRNKYVITEKLFHHYLAWFNDFAGEAHQKKIFLGVMPNVISADADDFNKSIDPEFELSSLKFNEDISLKHYTSRQVNVENDGKITVSDAEIKTIVPIANYNIDRRTLKNNHLHCGENYFDRMYFAETTGPDVLEQKLIFIVSIQNCANFLGGANIAGTKQKFIVTVDMDDLKIKSDTQNYLVEAHAKLLVVFYNILKQPQFKNIIKDSYQSQTGPLKNPYAFNFTINIGMLDPQTANCPRISIVREEVPIEYGNLCKSQRILEFVLDLYPAAELFGLHCPHLQNRVLKTKLPVSCSDIEYAATKTFYTFF